jgi:hypothetical protein
MYLVSMEVMCTRKSLDEQLVARARSKAEALARV